MDLLQWAIIALVISIIAGLFGFSGVSAGAATLARIFFGLFLVVALALFVMVLLGVTIFA